MKKHNRTILVDIDGVCLSWIPAFNRFMINQGFPSVCEKTFITGKTYGITDKELGNYVNKFHGGHWEFGTLPIHADAKEGIDELVRLGFRFVGITTCSTHPQAIALRRANLYNHFGDVFDEVHCLELSDSKRTYLEKYEPTIWIEDQTKNALLGLDYGHDCVVMQHSWNQDIDHDGLTLCENWLAVVEYIKEKFAS